MRQRVKRNVLARWRTEAVVLQLQDGQRRHQGAAHHAPLFAVNAKIARPKPAALPIGLHRGGVERQAVVVEHRMALPPLGQAHAQAHVLHAVVGQVHRAVAAELKQGCLAVAAGARD